jgi:hypothetical protein
MRTLATPGFGLDRQLPLAHGEEKCEAPLLVGLRAAFGGNDPGAGDRLPRERVQDAPLDPDLLRRGSDVRRRGVRTRRHRGEREDKDEERRGHDRTG